MSKELVIYVASATGKAVHLVGDLLPEGDLLRVMITQEMADRNIGQPVPATPFIKGKIAEGLIKELLDKDAAKKAYEQYRQERSNANAAIKAAQLVKTKQTAKIIAEVKKALQEEKAEEPVLKRGPKPKVEPAPLVDAAKSGK